MEEEPTACARFREVTHFSAVHIGSPASKQTSDCLFDIASFRRKTASRARLEKDIACGTPANVTWAEVFF